MSPKIPISLEGPNLGARHRYLNTLVNDSYNSGDSFHDILNLPESSHVDRLYKIGLASKHEQVPYIINNLQDDDMLYVSKALKSIWLLDEDYQEIINPHYLEATFYPHMRTTAVNKMKNWISLHLRDPLRCQQFYEYYIDKELDYALKFLVKCNEEIVLKDFPKKSILNKITPQRLKVLCEKTPTIAKIFYDLSTKDSTVRDKINRKDYFESIKCVLKLDPDIFLDITEKYFASGFKTFSAIATKFIMAQRKNRFIHKAELYTSHILNVHTLAKSLTPEECENLVIRLARAQYLESWFSYKNVEPFVKRLDANKRASIKKKIFVDKDVGEMVMKCPYDVPKSLPYFRSDDSDDSKDFDSDRVDSKDIFLHECRPDMTDRYDSLKLENRNERLSALGRCCLYAAPPAGFQGRSLLDALFDQYRFAGFEKTLFQLRKKIKCASSSNDRMFMFLVLVSKSGGKTENLQALFSLLASQINEPSHVRAAIIRSLVKRVTIWRVGDDIWENLLAFGHGLGLDGNETDTDCIEGLHAIVIRSLLAGKDCEPAIRSAYFKNFSTLYDYSLSATEKEITKHALLKMLVQNANIEGDKKEVAKMLGFATDVIMQYKMKVTCNAEFITAVKNLIKTDAEAGKSLVFRLFKSKLGRKELFEENVQYIQTDASFVNALKHDVKIITADKLVKALTMDNIALEQFMRKVSVYFMGNVDGVTKDYIEALKEVKMNKNIARPISYIIGSELNSFILELDSKDDECKRFSAQLRANAHVARPALDIDTLQWKKAGVKLIANKIISCKAVDIDEIIQKLLTWKKTVRLAIVLAPRTTYEVDVYAVAAKMRPTATLKSVLAYIRRKEDQSDHRIWSVAKPIIENGKSIKSSPYLLQYITKTKFIPSIFEAEYLESSYTAISQIDFDKALPLLNCISNKISKFDEKFIEDVLTQFLQNHFILGGDMTIWSYYQFRMKIDLHLHILIKYLLFSKTEDIQNERLKKVGQKYLDTLKSYGESTKNKQKFRQFVYSIITPLRDTEVFINEEYTSSLPLMEKITEWMRTMLPIEREFAVYVPLHLNMLFYKALRRTNKEKPGIYQNIERRDEAYRTFGEVFGKLIAQEARTLVNSYFESAIVLYGLGLSHFCAEYQHNKWSKVVPHIIQSIVNESSGIECTLGLQLYDDIKRRYPLRKNVTDDINTCFKNKDLKEMQFCQGIWKKSNYSVYNRHQWIY